MITVEPLIENAVWNPDLHPRDRLGRFRDVFKAILNMKPGQYMDLANVVHDAPNIETAFAWRTKDGWEFRGSTKSGTFGIHVSPADLAADEHVVEDRLKAMDETNPFSDKSKCGCGCGAPAKSTYLPGHDARHKGNLVKAALLGDQNAKATLESKSWTKFLDKVPDKNKPGEKIDTPAANDHVGPVKEPKPEEPKAPEFHGEKPPEDHAVSSGQAGLPADMLHDDPELAKHWTADDSALQMDPPTLLKELDKPNDHPVGQDQPEMDEQIAHLENQLDPSELPDQNAMELDDYIQALEDKIALKEIDKYDPNAGMAHDVAAADAAQVDDPYAGVEPYPDLPTCNCGCGNPKSPTAKYLPGHDSRHKSALVNAAKAGDKRAYVTLANKGWLKFLDKSKDTGPKKPSTSSAKAKPQEFEYDPSRVPVGLPISPDVYPNHRILDPGPGTKEEQLARLKDRRDSATSLVDRQMLNEAMYRIRGGHEAGIAMQSPHEDQQLKLTYGVQSWLRERGFFGSFDLYDNGKVNYGNIPDPVRDEVRKLLRTKAGRKELTDRADAHYQKFMQSNLTPSEGVRQDLLTELDALANGPGEFLRTGVTIQEIGYAARQLAHDQTLNKLAAATRHWIASLSPEDRKPYLERFGLTEADNLDTVNLAPPKWIDKEVKRIEQFVTTHSQEEIRAEYAHLEPFMTYHGWNSLVSHPQGVDVMDYSTKAYVQNAVAAALSFHRPTTKRWWDEQGRAMVELAPIDLSRSAYTGWTSHGPAASYMRLADWRDHKMADSGESLLSDASMHDVTFQPNSIDQAFEDSILRADQPDRGRAMIMRDTPFEDHYLLAAGDTLEPWTGSDSTVGKMVWNTNEVTPDKLRTGDLLYNTAVPGADDPNVIWRVLGVDALSGDQKRLQLQRYDDSSGIIAYKHVTDSTPITRMMTKPEFVPLSDERLQWASAVVKFDMKKLQADPDLQVTVTGVGVDTHNPDNHLDLSEISPHQSYPLVGGMQHGAAPDLVGGTQYGFVVQTPNGMRRLNVVVPESWKGSKEDSFVLLRTPTGEVTQEVKAAGDKPTFSIRGRVTKEKSKEVASKLLGLGAEEKKGTWNRLGSPSYGGWAKDKLQIAEKEATSLQLDLGDGKMVEFVPEPGGAVSATSGNESELRKHAKDYLNGLPEYTGRVYLRVPGKSNVNGSAVLNVGNLFYDPATHKPVAFIPSDDFIQAKKKMDVPDAYGKLTEVAGMPAEEFFGRMDKIVSDMKDKGTFVSETPHAGWKGNKSGQLFYRSPRDSSGYLMSSQSAAQAIGHSDPWEAKQALQSDAFKAMGISEEDLPGAQFIGGEVMQKTGKVAPQWGNLAQLGAHLKGQTADEALPKTVSGNGFAKNIMTQRRVFRMHGFTPTEAHSWLEQHMGIQKETHVPFKQIYRSDRKMGHIGVLHDDYADGSIKPDLGSRGLVHRTTADDATFENMVESGAVFSISEKTERRRINNGNGRFVYKSNGTSEQGDVGSGIDDVVFMNLGSGIGYIGGSRITLVYRTEAAMRKGSIFSWRDFGGGGDRNPKYRNDMKKWGADFDRGATPAQIADAARLKQMDEGSNELNVKMEAPFEDLGAVVVPPSTLESAAGKRAIEKLKKLNPDVEILTSEGQQQRTKAKEWISKYNAENGFNHVEAGVQTGGSIHATTYEPGTKVGVNPASALMELQKELHAKAGVLGSDPDYLAMSQKIKALQLTQYGGALPFQVVSLSPDGKMRIKFVGNPDAADGDQMLALNFLKEHPNLNVSPTFVAWSDRKAIQNPSLVKGGENDVKP